MDLGNIGFSFVVTCMAVSLLVLMGFIGFVVVMEPLKSLGVFACFGAIWGLTYFTLRKLGLLDS